MSGIPSGCTVVRPLQWVRALHGQIARGLRGCPIRWVLPSMRCCMVRVLVRPGARSRCLIARVCQCRFRPAVRRLLARLLRARRRVLFGRFLRFVRRQRGRILGLYSPDLRPVLHLRRSLRGCCPFWASRWRTCVFCRGICRRAIRTRVRRVLFL